MKKAIPYIILLVVAIAVFALKKCTGSSANKKTSSANTSVNRNHGFDRRVSYLEYTHHADCRMGCRHVTKEEVKEIMQNGEINYRKSGVNDRPCPTYALEGISPDGQKLRIVFAQCDEKTKVVTVIDLNQEWQCDCPGDDKKFQNRN